jgi:hypothetical protein
MPIFQPLPPAVVGMLGMLGWRRGLRGRRRNGRRWPFSHAASLPAGAQAARSRPTAPHIVRGRRGRQLGHAAARHPPVCPSDAPHTPFIYSSRPRKVRRGRKCGGASATRARDVRGRNAAGRGARVRHGGARSRRGVSPAWADSRDYSHRASPVEPGERVLSGMSAGAGQLSEAGPVRVVKVEQPGGPEHRRR